MVRNTGIGVLRGFAAFGIVGCHLSLAPMSQGGAILLSFCDCNVAIFAALAGYLMVSNQNLGWLDYVRRRAKRLLPVYVVWTVVFLVASALFQYVGTGAVKPRYADARWWLSVAFWGGAAAHLWFLISLFYAQSIMRPILPRIRKGIWVGASLVLVALTIPFNNWFVLYPIRLLAFLLLGYGLSGVDLGWAKRHQALMWLIVMIVIAAHFLKIPFAVGFTKDWIAAGPIILLFASLPSWSAARRLVVVLGATSMGVYLIHPLITAGFGVVVRKLFMQPYGVVPIMLDWVACWILALLVAVVLQRVPMFNRFVR